jgi:hypothetical protein
MTTVWEAEEALRGLVFAGSKPSPFQITEIIRQ